MLICHICWLLRIPLEELEALEESLLESTGGALIHNSLPSDLWLLKWAVVQLQEMSDRGRSDCRIVLL